MKRKYLYGLRCKLIHDRSAAGAGDDELDAFRRLTQKVLKKVFKVKWLTIEHRSPTFSPPAYTERPGAKLRSIGFGLNLS